jgi:hypothetical protein
MRCIEAVHGRTAKVSPYSRSRSHFLRVRVVILASATNMKEVKLTHLCLALDAFFAAQRRLVALLSLLGRLSVAVGKRILGCQSRVSLAARCVRLCVHLCMLLCSIRLGVTAAWM